MKSNTQPEEFMQNIHSADAPKKTQLENVKSFMLAFGQTVRDKPVTKDEMLLLGKERVLRARLILEEALECVNALGFEVIDLFTHEELECTNKQFNKDVPFVSFEHSTANKDLTMELVLYDSLTPNPVALLDGLVDLDYVAHKGTALAFGLQDLLAAADQIVHDSNITKLWTLAQLKEIDDKIQNREYIANLRECGRYYVHNKYGKGVKPPTFKAPDLKQLFPQ